MFRSLLLLTLAGGAAVAAWTVDWDALRTPASAAAGADAGPDRAAIAVEIATPRRGPLVLRRTYSGTLEAEAEFVVSAEVGGRARELAVELGDRVTRGQVVARIEDAEFQQAVAEAAADLAVARAEAAEAEGALDLARRRLERAETLRGGGITTEAALDDAQAAVVSSEARLEVTRARIQRAEASLEAARVRLGYTRVRADWADGGDERVVAARYVDAGTTIGPNTPLYSIVELDPVLAVVFVPERDFARIDLGQSVQVTVDAWPGESFEGRVARIAPVFADATRQARVELVVENPDERLRPGMFARATIEMERVDDALAVPVAAVVERGGVRGVFALTETRERVEWRPVTTGFAEGAWIQVLDREALPPVVTLGQELCEDGAPVTVFRADEGDDAPGADL